MDPRRFDDLAKHLSRAPQSRRAAVRRLASAGFAAALGGVGLAPARTRAQEASPASGTPSAGTLTEFLYIQTHTAGTLLPKAGEATAPAVH